MYFHWLFYLKDTTPYLSQKKGQRINVSSEVQADTVDPQSDCQVPVFIWEQIDNLRFNCSE